MMQTINGVNIPTSNDTNLKDLDSKLISLMVRFVTACYKQGINVMITQGFRSPEYQNGLYAIGRSKPGKIVTNCTGIQSPHCHGWAFDIAPLEKNGTINWSTNPLINNKWDKCGKIAQSIGLTWGGLWKSFPDKPHYELPGSSEKANQLYLTSIKK